MVLAVRRALGEPPPTRQTTLRLPEITQLSGRLVVVDLPDRKRVEALRSAFERGLTRSPRRWVAIAGPEVQHLDGLAPAMTRLREAVRTAELVGRSGWIPGTSELDLETLLSLDDGLRRLAIEAELGPLLRDARLGPELLTTLEAYFSTGQNAREAARRLHVAPRTVTYRLQRIRELRGSRSDADSMLRLAVAVFAYGLDRQHRLDRSGQQQRPRPSAAGH
jgi:DNA-binding PucR family transcriptional regulator